MVTESVCKSVHKVKMFKETMKRDKVLSAEEIAALLDACDFQRHIKPGSLSRRSGTI